MQPLKHRHAATYFEHFFSFMTLALSTSFLCTGPMLMPLTGMSTTSEDRKFSSASREPRVLAWGGSWGGQLGCWPGGGGQLGCWAGGAVGGGVWGGGGGGS